MIRRNYFIIFGFAAVTLFSFCQNIKENQFEAEFVKLDKTVLKLTVEASNLNVPWDLQYDKQNDVIVFSEIEGKIKLLDLKTRQVKILKEIDDVYHSRTLGLLGMALFQPENSQKFLFVTYTSKVSDSIYANLVRFNYDKVGELSSPKLLLKIPGSTGHNGSRIIISNDKKVFWATGDAASDTYSQDLNSMNGKILRLNLDGSIPKDNPIASSYVYALGFRNIQGLTQSTLGKIYSSEHGDAIEDEINWIQPLNNYGWPQIEGMHDTPSELEIALNSPRTEPIKSWTPVIAPAGLAYFNHASIEEWDNSLLLTALKGQALRILKLSDDGTEILDEHILFHNYLGRLRSVIVAPDGAIYFSTSNQDWNPQPGFPRNNDDYIYKLQPTKESPKSFIEPNKPESSTIVSGESLYKAYCASCHKEDGKGVPSTFPSLFQSAKVAGPENNLLKILLNGISSNEEVNRKYEGAMPAFSFLKDEEIASIASYIRRNFDNKAKPVKSYTVKFNR